MVDYGEHFDDETSGNMHMKRKGMRKYSWHKLSRAVSNLRWQRNHGGESTKK